MIYEIEMCRHKQKCDYSYGVGKLHFFWVEVLALN